MANLPKVSLGVDISKNTLDIYVYPTGKFFRVANTKAAIGKFIKELANYDIERIACEATGGYEKLLARLLKEQSYDLWVVDPRRIKGFIVASGCKSKTDKVDARKIAEFASKNSPGYAPIDKTKEQEHLHALVDRRKDLIRDMAAESTRLDHPTHVLSMRSIKRHIKFLEREIKALERQIGESVANDKELLKKSEILQSISGIGKGTSALLLAHVPELGQLTNPQASALIGVCPYDNASGNYQGKKFIRGGRMVPRNALYMCALTAIKHNPVLKDFYNRLIARGKPFKVAMVAVMHKLIIFANSILKKEENYMAKA
jgi:transposase